MATINKKSGLRSWSTRDKPKIQGWSEDPSFYNDPSWRNCRKAYIDQNPLCEVSRSEHKYHAAKEVDHIIPVRFGGSPYNPLNLMGLTIFYHRRKTGLEKHANKPLIDYIQTEDGFIPRNRSDIFKILIK